MAWTTPIYSRTAVDKAGSTYVDAAASPTEREIALGVINNWRSAHSFPLNTFQINLRRMSQHDTDVTVAQRIKRLPSIRHKLERFEGMKLSRIQDIGGCRAVLSDIDGVREVVHNYTASRMKHGLVRSDFYIDNPQATGYRGVHLIYRYFSDKSTTWNGLKIEVQIRTRLQHAWATAVETVGTFTQQALKSNQGENDWLRFFALMGSALALREGTAPVPNTPDNPGKLSNELRHYVNKLDVIHRLSAYGAALQFVEEGTVARRGHVFLLELDISDNQLNVRSYRDPRVAAAEYDAVERAAEGSSGRDVVLVSVESLESLRRAYPNYFLDTTAFLESVDRALG